MYVGIDADEVLLESNDVWLAAVEQALGRVIDREQILNWDFSPAITAQERSVLWRCRRPEMYENVHPVEGAQLGLTILRRYGWEPVVVTADTRPFVEAKARALRRLFGNDLPIIILKEKDAFLGPLVDDAVHNNPTYLMSKPWNRNKRHKGFRVNNWYELLDRLCSGWYV